MYYANNLTITMFKNPGFSWIWGGVMHIVASFSIHIPVIVFTRNRMYNKPVSEHCSKEVPLSVVQN